MDYYGRGHAAISIHFSSPPPSLSLSFPLSVCRLFGIQTTVSYFLLFSLLFLLIKQSRDLIGDVLLCVFGIIICMEFAS